VSAFTQQTYIRWCCIDLSNAPELTRHWPLVRQRTHESEQKLYILPVVRAD